jgi:hypothetical protein
MLLFATKVNTHYIDRSLTTTPYDIIICNLSRGTSAPP